jgi:hypothetical protein
MLVGYVRVSTFEQTLDLQRQAGTFDPPFPNHSTMHVRHHASVAARLRSGGGLSHLVRAWAGGDARWRLGVSTDGTNLVCTDLCVLRLRNFLARFMCWRLYP